MKLTGLTWKTALGLAGIALIWVATTAQSQLIVDVYPSQDNPDSETIWVFSRADPPAINGSSIWNSQNFHIRDSWKIPHRTDLLDVSRPGDHLYKANQPSNQFFNLTPLFSSTNNSLDIESVQLRISTGNRRLLERRGTLA